MINKSNYIFFQIYNNFKDAEPLIMHTINCNRNNCVCDKIINVSSTKYLGIILINI